jgi:hypothetical protein
MALETFCNSLAALTACQSHRQPVGLPASSKASTYIEDYMSRINAHTDIHASSRIRTHDSSVWTGEDSSCLRQRGHCNRP